MAERTRYLDPPPVVVFARAVPPHPGPDHEAESYILPSSSNAP
jgi:hypothetical protein